MSSLIAALITPPTADGYPTGVDDWRFVVEQYRDAAWVDLTPYWAGCDWQRGSNDTLDPRPETGVGTLMLHDPDDPFKFAAWLDELPDGADNVIRWGVINPTLDLWEPQFAGVIESTTDTFAGVRHVGWALVTLVETTAELARIDDFALSTPVGAHDSTIERYDRLLAEWRYGIEYHPAVEAGGSLYWPGIESTGGQNGGIMPTTLSANRLGEIKQLAETCMHQVRSSRRGTLVVAPDPFTADVPDRRPSPLAAYNSTPILGDPIIPLTINGTYLTINGALIVQGAPL